MEPNKENREDIKKAASQTRLRKCSVSFQMASLPFAGMIQIRFKGSSGKKDSQFKNAPSDHAKIRLFHIKYKSSFIDGKIN